MIRLTDKDADFICKDIRELLSLANDKLDKVKKDIEKIKNTPYDEMVRISAIHLIVEGEETDPEEFRARGLRGAERQLKCYEKQVADLQRMVDLLVSGSDIPEGEASE